MDSSGTYASTEKTGVLAEWDIVLTWYGYRQCTRVVICFFDMNGFIEKWIIRTFGAKHQEA